MISNWCALIPALLISLAWLVWTWRHQHFHSKPERVAATVQRLLKPRTPADCPTCRQQLNISPRQPHRPHPLRPWGEIKSRRGRPKRIATEGFACPRPRCAYYRITDAQVHALVGDGTHVLQPHLVQ